MDDLKWWLGRRLKEFLRLKGCSIPQVAKKMDKDPSYLYRVQRGEENPTIEQIDMIVRACGSNLSEFFAPLGKQADPAEAAAEKAAALAEVDRLMDDPAARAGLIASIFAVAASRPGKSSRSKKKSQS